MTTATLGSFRQQLVDRASLIGSFIKTPSVHATEILGDLGYDFVVIDEEHGPLDRGAIDLLLLAAQAARVAGIVRVAHRSSILAALDMGAQGVLVPHVRSAAEAADAVAASRYAGGARGCSPSPRAGRYGHYSLAEHVARADAQVCVCVMIEDPDAVSHANEISEVEGVDAIFLGLGDLAVAMGEPSSTGPEIRRLAGLVTQAAQRHGKTIMATAPSVEAAGWLRDLGANALVVNSDQGLLRAAASAQLQAFRSLGAGDARVS
jgi:2-keto-3-deoxy-L-rhamnonate aldolase RhmA